MFRLVSCLVCLMAVLPAAAPARQGGAPTPAEVAKLIEQLDDLDFDVRAQAEQRLEKFGALTQAALAEATSKHKDREVRERARAVLRRIHDARVSGLIKSLSDRDVKTRDAAEKELSADLKA